MLVDGGGGSGWRSGVVADVDGLTTLPFSRGRIFSSLIMQMVLIVWCGGGGGGSGGGGSGGDGGGGGGGEWW